MEIAACLIIIMKVVFQHGLKKIRNSLLSSTELDDSKRTLMLNQKKCLWSHFQEAYQWDLQTNSLRVYHKLTDDHIYVSDANKMRNHLATDVLNSEMLHLMEVNHFPLLTRILYFLFWNTKINTTNIAYNSKSLHDPTK